MSDLPRDGHQVKELYKKLESLTARYGNCKTCQIELSTVEDNLYEGRLESNASLDGLIKHIRGLHERITSLEKSKSSVSHGIPDVIRYPLISSPSPDNSFSFPPTDLFPFTKQYHRECK